MGNKCILDGCIARFQLSEVFMNSVASTGQYPDLDGGFKYFLFSPLFGEDFHFDQYFSDGLVQPPTSDTFCLPQKYV